MTYRAALSAALLLFAASTVNSQTAVAAAFAPAYRQRRSVGRSGGGRRGQRDPGRLLRVDGSARPGSAEAGSGRSFTSRPRVAGTFRWSGTTILIFTPAHRLPLATKYDVTIDASAAAESGRRLERPYPFTFTTPTARLLQTHWYRPGGRFDRPPIIVLRFNQPVKPEDVAAHVTARFERHPFDAAGLFRSRRLARLRATDPNALQAFDAKVAASARGGVSDLQRHPSSRDGLGQETISARARPRRPRGDGRCAAGQLGEARRRRPKIPSLAGPAVSGKPQDYTIKVLPTFFIDGFDCQASCDPEFANPVKLRVPVKADAFAACDRRHRRHRSAPGTSDPEIRSRRSARPGSATNHSC